MKELLVLISFVSLSFATSLGCKDKTNMYAIAQSQGEDRKSFAMYLINTGECRILNYLSKSDIKETDGYLVKVKFSDDDYWVIKSTIR